jgi:prepilin-type processing-associated H-X9-DG protein
MHQQCLRRLGVTRAEVLVVGILVVLGAGLLLAFLPRQGERDKAATCLYHLRVQGEAIRDFSGLKGPFAEAKTLRSRPCLPPSRLEDGYATWMVVIAPYLSAKNALADWDESRTYYDQPESVRSAGFPIQFCPARVRSFAVSRAGDVKEGVQYPGTLGDYAAAVSDGEQQGAWDGPDSNGAMIPARIDAKEGDRILAWSGRVTRADLENARGLAYTLIVGEKHVPPQAQGEAQKGDGSVYNGAHSASFARLGGPDFPIARDAAAALDRNFGSAHIDRCNFLFADGSVKGFNLELDPALLGRWIRRD